MASVEPSDTIFALSLASDDTTTSPLTVKLLLTVVLPLTITLKASDFALEAVPFPITKAVLLGLGCVALLVTVAPPKLYCPITKEPKSLAIVLFPIAVEAFPFAAVNHPIAVEEFPLAVV